MNCFTLNSFIPVPLLLMRMHVFSQLHVISIPAKVIQTLHKQKLAICLYSIQFPSLIFDLRWNSLLQVFQLLIFVADTQEPGQQTPIKFVIQIYKFSVAVWLIHLSIYFIAEKNKLVLAEKYKELKEKGQLDSFMKRKRKHNAKKGTSLLTGSLAKPT